MQETTGSQNPGVNPQTTSEKKINLPPEKLPVKMLTKRELHEVARERVSLIAKEFTDGFRFLEHYPRSVSFFGSARFSEHNPWYAKARRVAGRIVKELHYAVLSGGGPGIMEAANRGAFEEHGDSLGLTIEIPTGQAVNPYITRAIDFHYFFARKVCLGFASEAYLFFPGGLGTFDEVFEILTLVQTHKIEKVPVILVGAEFWRPIEDMLRNVLLTAGTIHEDDFKLYTITDDEDEILRIIKHAAVRNGLPFSYTQSGHPTDLDKTIEKKHIELVGKHCHSCEGQEKPFDHVRNEQLLSAINQWILVEDHHIEKTLQFKTFAESMHFLEDIAGIAEAEGHHPDLHLFDYNKVRIVLTTHAIGGLSDNDYILAAKIDDLLRA